MSYESPTTRRDGAEHPAGIVLAYLRHGDELHVLGTPTGSIADLRPVGNFNPDWRQIDHACHTLRSLTRASNETGEMSARATDEIRSACGFLYDELVPLPAKRWLRGSGAPLSLSLPPDLLWLPWELLHTGRDHLGLERPVGRLVQLDVDPSPPAPLTSRPAVLVVADPDGSLDHAYDEGVRLAEQLRRDDRVAVTLRTSDVDAAFVRRELRRHAILHYAGHVDDEGWRMSESRLDTAALERSGGGGGVPSLVFANGCAGAAVDDFEGSMLRAWLVAGARHVVGPLYPLPDPLGARFADAFYAALSSGRTVGQAARSARRRLARSVGEGATPWAAYVVYGDPNTRYVAPVRAGAVATPDPGTRPTRLTSDGPPPLRAAAAAIPVFRRPPSALRRHGAFCALLGLIVALALAAIAAASSGPAAAFGPEPVEPDLLEHP